MNADEASAQRFPTTGDDLGLDGFSTGIFLGNDLDMELVESLVEITDQAWVDDTFLLRFMVLCSMAPHLSLHLAI